MTDPTRPARAPRRRRAAGAPAVPATEAAPAEAMVVGEAPAEGTEEPRRPGLPAREARSSALDDHDALELARRVVDLAADKKAADIVLLGVGSLTSLADYFVICSGGSERQLGAIADGISEGMREVGVRPIGREGAAGAHWVLLDFGAVIVHIFAAPERDFYQLERLWADAPTLLRVQ
ncbi:MAG TPA: ribosome silencing factor [Candidatus Limnocylindrales bacterium]|nr:ribosome silencing factor [Candidatus Limnocylindrales bacterium]